ncbi:MAG: proline dehydrogenase family protein [Planctomycetota bacterium]|nr:proline dehydrogenase family protein [Planctomycetota bacterium]
MSILDRAFALGIPLVPRPILRRLSQRYVAGEHRKAALALGTLLSRAEYNLTFDVLGEAVSSREDVEHALQEYRSLIADLQEADLELNLSLKPTQMGLLLGESFCEESVSELVSLASEQGGFVRYEMEDSPTTDATLRVFRLLHKKHGNKVGCVIQSMLRRSANDVTALLADCPGLNIRLVKGIYVEPEDVAFQSMPDINESYLQLTRQILEGGGFVGAATHDPALVLGLRKLLDENPEWKNRFELQVLLGVGEELRRECLEAGLHVRVYIPYGAQWLPYVQRRLRKNPKLARYAFWGLFKKRDSIA